MKKLVTRSLLSLISLVGIGGLIVSALAREERLYEDCMHLNSFNLNISSNLGDGRPIGDVFEAPPHSGPDPVDLMCAEDRFLPFRNARS